MRKFLLRVLLPVIMVLSVLFFLGEFYLRSLPNDFKAKNQYLEEHANDLKIIVLGASTVSMGIKPAYFDLQPAYNFGYVSQSYDYNLLILSKCFDQMDSLKYVILDMSWNQPWNCKNGNKDINKNKFYRLYYGFPSFPIEFEMSASVKELFHRIRPSNGKEAMQTIDEDGYQSGYYEDIPYDEASWVASASWSVEQCAKRLRDEAASSKKYKKSVGYMCGIIELCRKKNVQVIMVTPPAMKMFYAYLDVKQTDILYHLADSLEHVYDNVLYLDYFKSDSLFSENELYNPTHLNPRGAKKFTLMLNDTINKLENIL